MTVSSTQNRIEYVGNGSTAGFAVPFMFTKDSDLLVALQNIEGVEKTQQQGTQYTLSGAGQQNGGVCTMASAPQQGERLVIKREPAIVQETDYLENDAFPAQSHEAALDLLTMICQSLSERLDRTVSLRLSSAVTGVEVPDPEPGRVLAWNEDGDNLANRELAAKGLVALPLAVSQGGTGAKTASAALAALGGEPADDQILKGTRRGQTLWYSINEPYLQLTDATKPSIDLRSRGRFIWTLKADRTFPLVSPTFQGEWHFNIYTQGHSLTIDPGYAGKIMGEIESGADMHRLALVYDGVSTTLCIDNRGV